MSSSGTARARLRQIEGIFVPMSAAHYRATRAAAIAAGPSRESPQFASLESRGAL